MAWLKDFLQRRLSAVDAAVKEIPESEVTRPELAQQLVGGVVDRFLLEPLVPGQTTVSDRVREEDVQLEDPRLLGPDQRPRTIRVQVFDAFIPISGTTELLAYWPSGTASEPDERVWFDKANSRIVIPARHELGDDRAGQTRRFLQTQDVYVRKLIAATNADIARWNEALEEAVSVRLNRLRGLVERRHKVKHDLGFEVTQEGGAVPYRLPRRPVRRREPLALEDEEYPLLTSGDFQEVLALIRRWADFIPEHPQAVSAASEEPLRDSLLHNLNTAFGGGTAESFSKLGKTDIRVVVVTAADSGVSDLVFKAECKIWDGASSVDEAVIQLCDRYLTFRETRAALIFFVVDRKDVAGVRTRAVEHLASAHRARLVDEISGWPVVALRQPDHPERVVHLAVVTVDVTASKSN